MFNTKLTALIFLYLLSHLNAQSTESNSSLLALEKLYHIEEDGLVSYQGIKYLPIPYKDALHEDLCFVLKDPEQAHIIHEAYSHHILPILSEDTLQAFSSALLKVCLVFGSNQFSPEPSLLTALKEEKTIDPDWLTLHQKSLKRFVSEANQPARTPLAPKTNNDTYTIAILTTSASGGNQSVTAALKNHFSSYKNIECVVVDAETIAQESDPIMLATGATTYDGTYATMFQQSNEGMDILIQRDEITKKLEKYIPSCLGLKLKEKMRELNPNLILSTRNYTADDIPLCTLGVPFRLIHCDYELSIPLIELYDKIQPYMMQFWIPCLEPQFFHPLFAKKGRLDLYDAQDSSAVFMGKIAYLIGQPVEAMNQLFEPLGFPVCPQFHCIQDPLKLEELRKKWSVQPNEVPILISMGKNGVGILEKVFDDLMTSPPQRFPLKFIFVCGKNSFLKNKLEQKVRENNAGSRFAIYEFLSHEEMNELMNICSVKISKPGGSVTAEILTTGTHLLIAHSHPWEEANGSKIERAGRGQKLQADPSTVVQIENYLEKMQGTKKLPYTEDGDWKKLLMKRLKEARLKPQTQDNAF